MTILNADGLPRSLYRTACSGLLFVGDPHLTCVRPGRRVEDDFLAVGLDKIRQSREIAEANNLFMVYVGDLVDNPSRFRAGTTRVVEDTGRLIAGFAQAMNFRECVVNPGNHDKHEVRLTPDCTVAQMRDLRLVHVIEPGGAFAIFDIDGVTVGLGGTPYGEAIPSDVRGAFGEPVDRCVWLTHDLFVFDHKIPLLRDPPEILGVDLAVNGHDHETQAPRQIGQTQWYNIGNITRMAVDCASHVPAVWEWNPKSGMRRHVLRYNELAFEMTGLQIAPDAERAHEVEKSRARSLFAELLKADQASDLRRSGSGDIMAEDIEAVLTEKPQVSEAARLIIQNLHRRSILDSKIP